MAMVLKLRGVMGPKVWLPAHECEAECPVSEHSDRARAALRRFAEALPRLGYAESVCIRQVRNCDPSLREAAAIVALNADRQRCMQVAYLRSTGRRGEKEVVSVTGALLDSTELRLFEFVGHNNYFDAPDVAQRIRVRPRDIAAADAAMVRFLERNPHRAWAAADLQAFRRRAAEADDLIWESHVNRGLYVPVGGR
ncbi:hypothetical protein DB347_21005 [Opitutaceae bacterium EW11]|nr:hypothetical protein DB347_21005 [Opitutaceae bacterium EW11]